MTPKEEMNGFVKMALNLEVYDFPLEMILNKMVVDMAEFNHLKITRIDRPDHMDLILANKMRLYSDCFEVVNGWTVAERPDNKYYLFNEGKCEYYFVERKNRY